MIALDPYYRIFFPDGQFFDCNGDAAATERQIAALHPKDTGGYAAFLDATRRIHDRAFADFAHKPFDSPWTFLKIIPELIRLGAIRSVYGYASRYFEHPRLRTIFSFHPLFIGGNPLRASAIYSMIPYLDPELFRATPKIFCGYSDITALHLWLMRRVGLRVFHGPTVDDLIPSQRDPTMSSLLSAITVPRPVAKLGRDVARTVRPGRATGRLTGGNLSLVTQTIGTPYEIDTRDAILFLEETRDPMSFADERLVHLRAAGLLRHVRGIVFGHLSLDRSEEDEFEDFIVDLVSDLGVPIIMDFPAGHEVPNLTLPFGTEVELVADEVTGWLVYRDDALTSAEVAAVPADATTSATAPVA